MSCPANYRTKVAIIVLLLFLSYVVVAVGIIIFLRTKQQWVLGNSNKTLRLPDDIKQLKEEYRNRIIKLMQSEKTKSGILTDGVDIVIRRCKIDIRDGNWTIDRDITDDIKERFQRAIIESKSKASIQNDSLENDSYIKDESTKNTENNHTQSDSPNEVVSVTNRRDLKVQSGNQNNISTKSITNFTDLADISPIVDKSDVDETDEVNIISLVNDNAFSNETKHNIETLNSIRNIIEGNTKDNENETIIDTETIGDSKENEDENKSSSLVIPKDLMSRVLSTTSTSNIPSRVYSLCGLWDFAGQREFYATHQAFLTSSAVYLVVANMFDDITNQNMKQYFADFDNVGEYIDFWFDSIHCHRTVEPPIHEQTNEYIDPPVIIVFTRKDEYEKANRGKKSVEERKKELQTQLRKVLGNESKYHHLRRIFWLSNTDDSDKEFEKLRLEISAVARKLNNWGEVMPLKWVLLENLIEIIKKGGKDFINDLDMFNMAKHPEIKMTNYEDVLVFLRFQHKVGNVIFFDDVPDFIILNPQWLVNAFRCLVSDQIDDKLQHRDDWIEFEQSGKISETLIMKLFELKGGNQFVEQKEHLLKVMEKFDILVKIGETGIYIVPSMTPPTSFDDVCKKLGVEESSCKRTSWFCLKFKFLPPAFFNHFSVWFMRNYEPSKVNDDRQSLALFRGISIFDIDKSGCEKLLVTMSTDTVALQLLSFSTEDKDFGRMCSDIRTALIRKTEDIKEKYKLTICYDLHFKCSKGRYYEDTISFKN
ncbi:unnamed protein product [Mytilus edulis]|uniref:COR domain-containing protein n=1 Tax=Mytilus edulis TaxID=6550 RepID=A0A8S3V0N1_MYTED|nr:unnamed protein product [Mytilus edulis]